MRGDTAWQMWHAPTWKNDVIHKILRNLHFEAWIYRCHIRPLEAGNGFRNSPLVVDEDIGRVVIKTLPIKIVVLKPLGVGYYVILQRCKMMI